MKPTTLCLLTCLAIVGCMRGEETSSDPPSTSVQELEKFCQLPAPVNAVRWATVQINHNDWALVAVLEPENLEEFAGKLTANNAESISLGSKPLPPWTGAKTIAIRDEDGSYSLNADAATFDVDPFAKSPLLQGVLIRLDATSYLLVLSTH